MNKHFKQVSPLGRIALVFTGNQNVKRDGEPPKFRAMRLNFSILDAILKKVHKTKALSAIKILNNKSPLAKQTEKVCSKQDIELFSYKKFFYRNQLALRRAVQWNFSREETIALIGKMERGSSRAFKRHLITPLQEKPFSEDPSSNEKQWSSVGGISISAVPPL